jgi:precorrin-3B synthase
MAQVVAKHSLPVEWTTIAPKECTAQPKAGPHPMGGIFGAAFGQIDANVLATVLRENKAHGLRVTPWRLFLLEGVRTTNHIPFITNPDDPRLTTHACSGAPYCPQASVETRKLASQLAVSTGGNLHVSGCAKGCALPHAADVTLVGRDGAFDLVLNGSPWEEPSQRGLDPNQIINLKGVI